MGAGLDSFDVGINISNSEQDGSCHAPLSCAPRERIRDPDSGKFRIGIRKKNDVILCAAQGKHPLSKASAAFVDNACHFCGSHKPDCLNDRMIDQGLDRF